MHFNKNGFYKTDYSPQPTTQLTDRYGPSAKLALTYVTETKS